MREAVLGGRDGGTAPHGHRPDVRYMTDAAYELAQVDIARLNAPLGSPRLKDLVDALDPVNASADAADGFVRRLRSEGGDATDIPVFGDARPIVDLTVRRDADALTAFMHPGRHREMPAWRREWFEKPAEAVTTLWWVPAGHRPTVAEGLGCSVWTPEHLSLLYSQSTSSAQGIDELADRQSHKTEQGGVTAGNTIRSTRWDTVMTTLTEADALEGLRDALGLLKDREQVAERLLDSSAKHSFDPDKELDWDAPFEDGKWFWPPELVSLYDTPMWQRMSEEQRILLSQHEAAALASLGIWFELILMQLLVRHIYDKSATSAHVRYALTEIEDECRHSKMFARLISRGGTPWYPVSPVHQHLGRLFKTISTTPGSFTATLLGEEVLDWMQRLTFPDERVQPLIRGVTRIHVVEEARHVRYAREELRRQMVTAPKWSQEFTRVTSGEFARVFSIAFINPEVYTNVGLDKREALAQVKASGHRKEIMQTGAKRLTDFLDDIGVLRGVGRKLWRSSGLLA